LIDITINPFAIVDAPHLVLGHGMQL